MSYELQNNNTDKYNFSKHSTICWNCGKACGLCSWSKSFIPVDGWCAVPTKILISNTGSKRSYTDSFDVYECPEFELLKIEEASKRKR